MAHEPNDKSAEVRPTADQLRGMLDPEHELYGKSWSSERGWHDPEDGEAFIVVPSSGPTGPQSWMPLRRGSEAWVQGRALFHASSGGQKLSGAEEFIALSYVNSRAEEDIRDDFLFGMRDQGHIARRYLRDRTWLGRMVDRLLGRGP